MTHLASTSSAPPRYESVVVGAAAAAAVLGLVGLVLALLGQYTTFVALLLTAGILSCWAWWRRRPRGADTAAPVDVPTGRAQLRASRVAATLAAVIALVFTSWAAWAPSHHVLINRDPGSYSATARWLSQEGTLTAEARTGGLHDEQLLRVDGFAVYDVGGGQVQFQFTHLTAVVFAAAHDVGGAAALFRAPALVGGIGLLALYAVAVRALRRPWLALVPLALTATSLPFLYVSRDTFSEPVAFALVWSALLAGLRAAEGDDVAGWLVTGVIAGAAIATRPDLLLVGAALGPLVVAHALGPIDAHVRHRRSRGLLAVATVTAVGATIGLVDLITSTGEYASRHGRQVVLAGALGVVATAAAAVVAVWVRRSATCRERLRAGTSRVAAPVAVSAMALLAAAWWVRPHVQVSRGRPVDLVAALQEMAGVAIEPTRRYAELTVVWLGWYLGPVVLLAAIGGLGLATWRLARSRATPGLAAVTLMFLVVGGATLWRPVITPDHIWAMRRFVPVVIPALTLLAAVPLATSVRHPTLQRAAPPVVVTLVAAMLVGTVSATWPLRQLREQHGYAAVLDESCDLVGVDAAVVVLGPPESDVLAQPMRSWCGVPVAVAREGVTADQLGPVGDAVREAGRTLVAVSRDPTLLEGLPGGGDIGRTALARDHLQPERTLLEPPRRYAPAGPGWSLAVRRTAS